jgi:hypothetical protein
MGPITLMQATNKNSIIKMHVVIGQSGMQQGLAFYQCLLLLKVLKFFSLSVFHVRTVFYAPHHSHTSIQWNK